MTNVIKLLIIIYDICHVLINFEFNSFWDGKMRTMYRKTI